MHVIYYLIYDIKYVIEGCPAGWERFFISGDEKCLRFFGTHLISNAESVCDEEGGTLPLPYDQEQQDDYLTAFTQIRQGLFHQTDVAIGANDVNVEGEWRDFHGNELEYTNWAHGEPNDFQDEDYAVMPAGLGYSTWNDVGDQQGEVAVICEIYSDGHHDYENGHDDDWDEHDDHHDWNDDHEWDHHDGDELTRDEVKTLITIIVSIVSLRVCSFILMIISWII